MTERPHIQRAKRPRRGPDFKPFVCFVSNLSREDEPFLVIRGENGDILSDEMIADINDTLDLETVEFEGVMGKDDYVLVVSPFKKCTQVEVEERMMMWIQDKALPLTRAYDRVLDSMEIH